MASQGTSAGIKLGAVQEYGMGGPCLAPKPPRSAVDAIPRSQEREKGTRHEYEQVPPQPNSKSPENTVRPAREMVKLGGTLGRSWGVITR